MKSVAIVIPAYNEEKNIPKLIKDLKKNIKNAKILIVDDGSTDKTTQIAKKCRVLVLTHKRNKGKGEALKTGFRYLKNKKYKKIIIMDADLQYSAKEVPKIVKALDKYDFVIGKRNWSKVPIRHALGNFVWRMIFNILYGTKLKDTNCGLMGFSKKIMSKLKVGGGYIIENMMLASAIKNNIKIGHVPVNVRYIRIHGLPRGARVVSGVLLFILEDGLRYRLSKLSK